VPAPQNDRYDPLPGFLSLPSFLYRKLGPRGRLAAKVGGTIFVVALATAAIVLLPRIAESNRDREAKERRDAAHRLRAQQRPQHGRAATGASRSEVVDELEAGILADARARAARGRLHGPPAKRVECEPLTGVDASADRVGYDCIAVTSDLPSNETLKGGVIGHPFRAVANFSTGRLTWCRVSPRPAEGSINRRDLIVRIPRACSR
jgi:hypothetical protein